MDEQLSEELVDVRATLVEIREEIRSLSRDVKKLLGSAGKLEEHIKFVERTYDGLKHPLNFITRKIEYLSGKPTAQIE